MNLEEEPAGVLDELRPTVSRFRLQVRGVAFTPDDCGRGCKEATVSDGPGQFVALAQANESLHGDGLALAGVRAC